MEKMLSGQIALISGGSRGIGAAVAAKLAERGAVVAVGYHQSKTQAEEVVRTCREYGVESVAIQGDVRFRSQVEAMVDRIEEIWGPPSILVHSAGITGESPVFQEVVDDEYDRVMDTHVRGAFFLIRRTLPAMVRNRFGRMILLSSIWGESGGSGEVLYSAAKGAINGMVRALGKETAPSGVTVNAVAPGAIQTDMLDGQLTAEEKRALVEEIPAGRLGHPAEVASMVCWLCGPDAGYITSQVLHINGGWAP
ncbi:elongation factor P 5-aminopentanone reductase [Desmospora profundinema]|uniref:3-oxoacyl-[acyl-carrier protein] reductase n=1 Tax=Desmospora profundinema TaxID=1571184 RepID=A0ABU1IKA8_9BACL|nr:3-oxoacyl-ACP reductase FabG [Desmospora profundinema]MDR6224245.1 3-oxoacyl-[acyl-carrier protein] reductase [Desmospora profundinema]